ncbi:DUF2304 domain-containing protein [Haloarculaceae archaeon H-GB11]|nr:DUF2304 domain-containing protein [Haloarculaceae archaeon H-GB11]
MMFKFDPIHAIGIIISLALFYQSARLVRKRKESVFEFLLWMSFGVVLFSLAVGSAIKTVSMREQVQKIFNFVGFSSGFEGLFALAILGLLLMLFYTYINAKTNRNKLYDLNQELALLRYEVEKSQGDEIPSDPTGNDD